MRCSAGQLALTARSNDVGDPVLVGGQGRAPRRRRRRSAPRMPAATAAIGLGRDGLGGQHLGEARVHLRGGRAELAGRARRSPRGRRPRAGPPARRPRCRGRTPAQRPGARDAGSSPSATAGQVALDRADHGRHPGRARLGQRALHGDVGVLAGLERAEDLADQRFRRAVGVGAVEDDRGVGLLAGQHLGRREHRLGRPRRVPPGRRRRAPGCRTRRRPGGRPAPARARAAGRRRPGRGCRRRPTACPSTLCSIVPTSACWPPSSGAPR